VGRMALKRTEDQKFLWLVWDLIPPI
jgi:hypothetical protein